MPLPEGLRNRTRNTFGEMRRQNTKERPPVGGAPLWLSLLFLCWERPQPELSPQLVYLWGVTVVCGYWQGTPGGFSRGLAEVPLSALLPPTSWARKKSARPPGRVPAIYAAAGGSPKAPRRGAKKAVRPQGGKSKTAAGAGPGNPRKIRAAL